MDTGLILMIGSAVMFVLCGIVKVRLGYSFWPWGD